MQEVLAKQDAPGNIEACGSSAATEEEGDACSVFALQSRNCQSVDRGVPSTHHQPGPGGRKEYMQLRGQQLLSGPLPSWLPPLPFHPPTPSPTPGQYRKRPLGGRGVEIPGLPSSWLELQNSQEETTCHPGVFLQLKVQGAEDGHPCPCSLPSFAHAPGRGWLPCSNTTPTSSACCCPVRWV